MKITSFKIILLVLYCSFPFKTLIAQDNYRPGYIITNSNDTIKGLISKLNINTFTKCLFKKSVTDKSTEYLPGDIAAYRFNDDGKYFISKVTVTPDGNKAYFLEYLIKGKANIYYMRDNVDHYYIETDNNKILELSEPDTKIEKKDGTTYIKPSSYKGKLKFMLAGCPEIYAEIENTKLFAPELIKLAKDYHLKVCNSESCIVFEKKANPVKAHIGFFTGLSLNSFNFVDVRYSNFGLGALLGCKLELENMFFSNEQSSLQVELVLQKYSKYTFSNDQTEYNYFTPTYYEGTYIKNFDINTLALKIPVLYKYMFSFDKIRPYAGAGITNQFILSQNSNLDINHFKEAYGNSIPFYHFGFIGCFGSKYMLKNNHNVFLELNFEITQNVNFNGFVNLKVANNNFSLLAGYTL